MKKRIAILLCLLFVVAAAVSRAAGLDVAARTHHAILSFLGGHPTALPKEKDRYEEQPVMKAPYAPGKLSAETIQAALNAVNQIRFVAGLNGNVTENPDYSVLAQAGALVNAVNGKMSHTPGKPADMSDELFELAYKGASGSCVSYGRDSIIKTIFEGWLRDGSSNNIDHLGHRRGLLNPRLAETGFGWVGTHMAMYTSASDYHVTDLPKRIAWPAQLTPVSWMSPKLPWSVSFRDGLPDAGGISVTLVRRSDGKTWRFSTGSADGFFNVDYGGYSTGPIVIFRPDNIQYSAGDHYDVTITGAEAQPVRYAVELYNFDLVESFVIRCYDIILGRAGDSEGIINWSASLRSGKRTAAEIIDSFMKSPEYTGKHYTNAESVEILYRAMMGREADEAGKAHWVEKLDSGLPFGVVINGFCVSKEFTGICETYGLTAGSVYVDPDAVQKLKIKAFVSRCYDIILGREADEGGMETWTNELFSKRKAASEIIDRFVNSPEFLGKNYSNGEAVEILYRAMLGRNPDEAGKAHWVAKLDAGQPFAAVINGFCISKEFGEICASYGIEPGSVKVNQARLDEPVSRTVIEGSGEEETASAAREIILTDEQAEEELDTAVMVLYYNRDKVTAFIRNCYNTILGRNDTDEAINSWAEQILNGAKTPDQIIRGFLFSGEFRNRNITNEDLVKILYKVYMYRDADPEGLATWTGKLDAGMTLTDLLDAFARTKEHKAFVSWMNE